MYGKLADVDVVLYCRISQDRAGDELGVTRQLDDARKLARARGWRVVAEETDNDVSASGRRRREGFERALSVLERGQAGAVVAWDWSRLSRNARDTLALLEIGERRGAVVALVRGSDMDLGTPAGRLTASVLASVARHEIEQKSDRQRRAVVQAAEGGRRVGGRRPFGYEADGMTVRESEAVAVRQAYEDVLAGVELGAVARAWNAAGLLTPQRRRDGSASRWSAQTVRPTLLNPRYAGLRHHVGAALRERGLHPTRARIEGIVGPAAWPPLVAEETWRAVVEVLGDPARRTRGTGGVGLLTGVARCGAEGCPATVHRGGAPARRGRDGYPSYRCRDCLGHLGRRADVCDWWVGEIVIGRLSRPDAADLLRDDDRPDGGALRVQAAGLRARLDGLARLLADGTLTEVGVRRESARLREQLAGVERSMADAGRVDVLAPLIGADDVRAVWEGLPVERRRVVIDTLMTVTLLPPGRGVRFGSAPPAWELNAERISASIRIDWK